MRRRTVLRSVGTVVGCAVTAGSVSAGGGQRVAVDAPTLIGCSFSVEGVAPGTGADQANATIGENTIELTGTITGATSCHTAQLASCRIANGNFIVAVETVDSDDDSVCLPNLTEITYQADFQFEPASPQRITVFHDDTPVLRPDSSGVTERT